MKTSLKITLLLLAFSSFGTITYAQKKSKKTPEPQTAVRIIEADVAQVKGATVKMWQECVGAGRANEGLRADWQEQLKLVKKEIGFKYIRMHGLLHDDMGVYTEDKKGNPVYNWQYIDQLYDFLLSIDMKPFVELSFMPQALASGDKTVFWWKGNITPPKSYDKWYDFMKALTEHFTERYGANEVKSWYFEVWNEPNISPFFTGTMADYLKLYDYTVKAIRAVNPEYKVGGPATAGNGWITETIEHCVKNNVPIDFIATHDYAVSQGYFDATGETGTLLDQDPMAITKNVVSTRNKILASSKPKLELHYTEWSTSYTPTDPVHDSYHSAAFILDKMKGTENVANSMSYWVFTDIFEESAVRTTPFHGGFGLLNYQTIKKPAYYCYQFLNRLGATEVKNADPASWICKKENGDIQTLFWDFTLTKPTDSVNNQVYYRRDLPSKDKGLTKIRLTNVPEGTYQLKVTKVGYQSNDAYATYLKLGSPSQLTKKQVETIQDTNSGAAFVNDVITVGANKAFSYQLSIHENDVYLVELLKN